MVYVLLPIQYSLLTDTPHHLNTFHSDNVPLTWCKYITWREMHL